MVMNYIRYLLRFMYFVYTCDKLYENYNMKFHNSPVAHFWFVNVKQK